MTLKHAPLALAGLLLTGMMVGGCGKKQDAQDAKGRKPGIGDPGGSIPVQVLAVTTGTIEQTVPVTGNTQALSDVQLSARAAGRVIAVNFREGQVVRAGQVVVQQDTTDLEANVRQAQAGVQSAQANVQQAQANVASSQAKLSQAGTNYTVQVQTAREAVAQARAQVAASRQNYLKVKGGSRPQQVLQGQTQVALAKANLENAQTILTRNKSLFAQGAIAKADLDTAQTSYDVQTQSYKNAQASLSLTQEGAQTEDIAAALAQLQQQQSNLQTAIANQQQVQVRRDDILAAQAAVQQARAAVQQTQAAVRTAQATLAFNQQQVSNAFIKSPIDGVVAARQVEPGQVASPGTSLLRIVNLGTVYYQPTIPETDFASTAVGDPVRVQVDALPGQTFNGKVSAVYPAASATNRVFSLRVTVTDPQNRLRPGMFARGQIITSVARNVVVVPSTALIPLASQQGFQANASSDQPVADGTQTPPQQVIVVGPGSVAQPRPVKIGIQSQQQAEVTSGLQPGERIVTVGQQGLKQGDKLAIIDGNGKPVGARTAQVP